jgi:transposase
MNITTVGVDLAKSVFQVHGVDKRGKVMIQKRLRRSSKLQVGVGSNIPT